MTVIAQNRLIFGTASISRLITEKNQKKILEKAYEVGFRHFDTSPYYGFGLSEIVLGQVFAGCRDVNFTSKVGLYPPHCLRPNSGIYVATQKLFSKIIPTLGQPNRNTCLSLASDSLFRSLERLQTDKLYSLMFHELQLSDFNAGSLRLWLDTHSDYFFHSGVAGEFGAKLCTTTNQKFPELKLQTRISVETNALLRQSSKKKYIFYGLHTYFEEQIRNGQTATFEKFLCSLACDYPKSRFIVSTLKLSRLESYRSLIDGENLNSGQ